MAENLDDGEFWLPPQILADDDIAMEKHGNFNKHKNDDADALRALFRTELPYGFVSSDLSSPVESVVGSSETESDEEEHMAELTRRISHSTLDSILDLAFGFEKPKSKGMLVSGSPQSTLCSIGSGCGCWKGSSSLGSPSSACQAPSPRATWDLLHAAAGEVERMKMSEDAFDFYHNRRGLLGPPGKPSPVTLPVRNTNPDVGLYNQQSLSHYQLQIAQFQMLRQQQMAKAASRTGLFLQRQSKPMVSNRGGRNNGRPVGLSSSASAWPPLNQAKQEQFGSGMRAVFLDNPAGRRECAGTGVFLPRRVDNPAESRMKPACSTVLVPARVMQALNLKLDNIMGGQPRYQPRFNGSSTMDNDVHVLPRLGNNHNLPQPQRRYLRPQQSQEWIY